jgi:hypothetical protein
MNLAFTDGNSLLSCLFCRFCVSASVYPNLDSIPQLLLSLSFHTGRRVKPSTARYTQARVPFTCRYIHGLRRLFLYPHISHLKTHFDACLTTQEYSALDLFCGHFPSKAVREMAGDAAFIASLLGSLSPSIDPATPCVAAVIAGLQV